MDFFLECLTSYQLLTDCTQFLFIECSLKYSSYGIYFKILETETSNFRYLTDSNFTGFGENLDGNGSWKACVKYVDDQFMAYFDGESGLNRKNIIDTRVHCCLYFIPPYGHGWVSCTPIM